MEPRRQQIARTHFDTLAALFNPGTFRRIEMLGIGPGWRCWEVGAGGATVPRWLAQRSSPGGRVLATDRDVSAMHDASLDDPILSDPVLSDAARRDAVSSENCGFEVLRHELGADPPPEGGFDLVHARLVLMHVHDRRAPLATMITALRPGGWLLVERLVGEGLATEAEIEQHLADIEADLADLASFPLVSAWGRKPGT